ncbi:hypothetical protein HHK36_014935 [Tetracentron sinense]|uniref:Phosphatidic acid phosphatase type 2/haloperoxidase domain-containing protein n=1 Tax=Tetracentron sinense TaxID=13715 RepID=A0A834YZV9_TETSI|nr:hypothetical protein HHK36_014935 [Tetracentron sinense]
MNPTVIWFVDRCFGGMWDPFVALGISGVSSSRLNTSGENKCFNTLCPSVGIWNEQEADRQQGALQGCNSVLDSCVLTSQVSALLIVDQDRMREVQLNAHTIKSHGVRVVRTHMHDWLILLLLVVIDVILNVIKPFYRFVGKDMMTDLQYPLKSNTVPVWAVPLYAVLLPIAIFIVFYFRRRDVYDLHHGILALLFSVLITGVLTDAIKDAVGRPRPDFFWRCFPDGKDFYDQLGNVICHGEKSDIKEGHKSFPSGHTSWSFAGLGFLSLYLAGKLKAFDRRGHVSKLCIVFLPLLAASLVAVSRVDDYWHHWQDVFAGGLLGLTVATFCYLQFFPPPYHTEGWGTYAYFRMLEESRVSTQPANAVNSHNGQAIEIQIVNQEDERSSNAFLGLSVERGSSPTLDKIILKLLGLEIVDPICYGMVSFGRKKLVKMPEIQLGAHTVKSHGVKVARMHMHDWLILLLLVVIEVSLNFIEPFHRFVGEDMMTDLKYPLKSNTVPFWAVPIIAILLPLAVFILYYFYRRNVYDLHHAILGLLFSVLITGVLTDAIKDAVGRPRPDFFWRCFPDGKGVFDPVTKNVMCNGEKSVIKEGHKSFPSGHTSWSYAGLGFLAWYLSGKIRVFDHRGHVAKLCYVLLPLLVAALVGVSRVDDYWHHWQDVFAGGLLGWGPHAYFQMLEESRNDIQSSSTNTNFLNVRRTEIECVYMQPEYDRETTEVITRDASPILDAMEAGRKH